MKLAFYSFFKSIDRYGNSVQLTYNGKKSFPSFCGGVATMITIFACIYWWAITAINHLVNPYRRYSFQQVEFLTSDGDNIRPIWSLNY